ncbi:MAG TPA: vitamin K epoxide reductase family protein [Gaiellaceae bacterium]
MSDRALRLVMAALAAAVVGIAGYLLQAHYSGGSIVCSTGGCETVQQSSYSEIFGIPVALVGLVGAIAILASLVRGDLYGRAAGVTLAVSGFIFAAYLVIVQLTVINAVCEWCIASDSLMTVMAAVALWRARTDLAQRA